MLRFGQPQGILLSFGRQRAEYYCLSGYRDDEFEYPVFQQIEGNIDLNPAHSIEQVRQYGAFYCSSTNGLCQN